MFCAGKAIIPMSHISIVLHEQPAAGEQGALRPTRDQSGLLPVDEQSAAGWLPVLGHGGDKSRPGNWPKKKLAVQEGGRERDILLMHGFQKLLRRRAND